MEKSKSSHNSSKHDLQPPPVPKKQPLMMPDYKVSDFLENNLENFNSVNHAEIDILPNLGKIDFSELKTLVKIKKEPPQLNSDMMQQYSEYFRDSETCGRVDTIPEVDEEYMMSSAGPESSIKKKDSNVLSFGHNIPLPPSIAIPPPPNAVRLSTASEIPLPPALLPFPIAPPTAPAAPNFFLAAATKKKEESKFQSIGVKFTYGPSPLFIQQKKSSKLEDKLLKYFPRKGNAPIAAKLSPRAKEGGFFASHTIRFDGLLDQQRLLLI